MRTRFMTTLVMVASLLVSGQALTQPQLPTFQSGDVLRADQLNRIVEQVRKNTSASGGSGGGSTLMVDCNNAGETIQSKVDEAQPGDTIEIAGMCNEAVVVSKDGITLDGGGSAVIDGSGIDRWAVDVTGRQEGDHRGTDGSERSCRWNHDN